MKKSSLATIGAVILVLGSVDKAHSANFFFTPSGSQLDSDPILDISTAPGDILSFDVKINDDDIIIPGIFNGLVADWSFTFDNSELGLLSQTNPSPSAVPVGSGDQILSTVTFEVLNPGLSPHDGLADFGITLNSVVALPLPGNPDEPLDLTDSFPSPSVDNRNLPGEDFNQVVEVQQQVPEPISILGLLTASSLGMTLKRKKQS